MRTKKAPVDVADKYADPSVAASRAARTGLAGTKNRQRAALALEADQTTLLAQLVTEQRRTNDLLEALLNRPRHAETAPLASVGAQAGRSMRRAGSGYPIPSGS